VPTIQVNDNESVSVFSSFLVLSACVSVGVWFCVGVLGG